MNTLLRQQGRVFLKGRYKIFAHIPEVKICRFKATYLCPKFFRFGDTG